MPTKNLEKLVMTRALVKEEARLGKWNQDVWANGLENDYETGLRKITCGTTACVAGWAVISDGGKFLDSDTVLARDTDDQEWVFTGWDLNNKGVPAYALDRRARDLLGLDADEASDLFAAHNTYDDVMELLGGFIKEARKERRAAAKKGKNA
jgi:hypothetical protein